MCQGPWFKLYEIFDIQDLDDEGVKELLAAGFKRDWEDGAMTYIGSDASTQTPGDECAYLYHPDHWDANIKDGTEDFWVYEHSFRSKSNEARGMVEADDEFEEEDVNV